MGVREQPSAQNKATRVAGRDWWSIEVTGSEAMVLIKTDPDLRDIGSLLFAFFSSS